MCGECFIMDLQHADCRVTAGFGAKPSFNTFLLDSACFLCLLLRAEARDTFLVGSMCFFLFAVAILKTLR